jgi:hypothetical protein
MTLKVGFPYVGNEQRYVDTAVDLYRKMLPHAGKDKAWWQRAIENTLKGYVGTRYESYTKKLLFDMYRTLYNFTGSKVGDISGNEVVFPFMSLSHLNPNVIGSIAAKQMDNPGVKYILLYSVGSLMGKNDDKLKAERRKVTDWVAKVSKHYGWSIVVYFAPQIKTGPNKENLYQFRIKP